MATIQQRSRPEKPATPRRQIVKGFSYLTLDPAPRLRRMREEQQKMTMEPTEVVRRAWESVGAAITEALRVTSTRANSPTR
jgi:hypothetical protein